MSKFLNNSTAVYRLIEEYTKHGHIIVAFDFDNTVCTYNPRNPEPTAERPANEQICELIRRLRPYAQLIVWTCRADNKEGNFEPLALTEALNWLKAHDVPYDLVNEDGKVSYGGSKIYYNILLDDRSGLPASFEALVCFLNYVEGR